MKSNDTLSILQSTKQNNNLLSWYLLLHATAWIVLYVIRVEKSIYSKYMQTLLIVIRTRHNVYYCVSHQRCSSTIISYTTIGYKYSFVHGKSKEGDLYLVDNVENGIILSPEGPNFEGRPREN